MGAKRFQSQSAPLCLCLFAAALPALRVFLPLPQPGKSRAVFCKYLPICLSKPRQLFITILTSPIYRPPGAHTVLLLTTSFEADPCSSIGYLPARLLSSAAYCPSRSNQACVTGPVKPFAKARAGATLWQSLPSRPWTSATVTRRLLHPGATELLFKSSAAISALAI